MGYLPPEFTLAELMDHLLYGRPTLARNFMGIDTTVLREYGIRKLKKAMLSQKGVFIGVNDRIMGMRMKPDPDEIDGFAVMIRLPQGLDVKYVSYVHPLGPRERVKLEKTVSEFSTARNHKA